MPELHKHISVRALMLAAYVSSLERQVVPANVGIKLCISYDDGLCDDVMLKIHQPVGN